MSIEISFQLISNIFGNNKIIYKIPNAFYIIINQKQIDFCYNEQKGLIGRLLPPYYVYWGIQWYHRYCVNASQGGIRNHDNSNHHGWVSEIFNINALDNQYIKNYDFKTNENIFSKELIFTGIEIPNYDICRVTSISYLNEMLEKEWSDIKNILINKYMILIEITNCADVANLIIKEIYLLGN